MSERQRGETKAVETSLLDWTWRIDLATADRVLDWGERLAGARSLEEVFRW